MNKEIYPSKEVIYVRIYKLTQGWNKHKQDKSDSVNKQYKHTIWSRSSDLPSYVSAPHSRGEIYYHNRVFYAYPNNIYTSHSVF